MTLYKNNLEHLLEELYRIDLIIRLGIERWRAEHQEGVDEFQGLYISEDEVNAILQAPPYRSNRKELNLDLEQEDSKIKEILEVLEEINRKKAESLKKGKDLRLPRLTELFNLRPFEVDVILICLAGELDIRYEKLYSYLQNDVTKRRPTVDMVINLLCRSMEERLRARESFLPGAPLLRNQLVHLGGDGPDTQQPLLSRFVKVDERVISFLLGSDEIDPRVQDFSKIIEPKMSFKDLLLPGDNKDTLMELTGSPSRIGVPRVPMMLFFYGPYGTGKKSAAEAVSRELGTSLLVVDMKTMMDRVRNGNRNGESPSEILGLILREGILQNSAMYLEGFDSLIKDRDAGDSRSTRVAVTRLIQELDSFPNWVFLSGETQWELTGALENHGFISLAFPMPSFVFRKQLWKSFLNGRYNYNISDDVDIDTLASKFNFSGGQIRDAIFTAYNIAVARGQDGGVDGGVSGLSMDDLYQGCKAQSNKKLTTLARKVVPHYTFEDIVLPEDRKAQLKEVCGHIKYRSVVYADWGFDKKFSYGNGLNILFSGSSGTGKTMAAEIIAGEAKLDLYKIDLSCVVSKYIGETEKNLSKIFKEAETSNAILFFDEADALFGKRSEVRDSHDRYANIEINYLLQKMEEHEGTVILASNFKKNIDDAFLRRMHFTIEFPFPDEKSRERIWRNIFPQETPLGRDIDFRFLAKFKITGGNIKNIALCAAFLAAGDSGVVRMEHIIRATKREFQKMGKLLTPGDFGKYYKMVI